MPRSKANPQIVLRPQDLVVLLYLSQAGEASAGYSELAAALHLTASEVHQGIDRSMAAKLARKDARGRPVVIRESLKIFVQQGARYCYPAVFGPATRGMPTGYAAPPLNALIVQSDELPPVWPHKNGHVRGLALYPLYPTVPQAASQSQGLYELLALFDAVRAGSMRERALAMDALTQRLDT